MWSGSQMCLLTPQLHSTFPSEPEQDPDLPASPRCVSLSCSCLGSPSLLLLGGGGQRQMHKERRQAAGPRQVAHLCITEMPGTIGGGPLRVALPAPTARWRIADPIRRVPGRALTTANVLSYTSYEGLN